jgi:hypothetical protein
MILHSFKRNKLHDTQNYTVEYTITHSKGIDKFKFSIRHFFQYEPLMTDTQILDQLSNINI